MKRFLTVLCLAVVISLSGFSQAIVQMHLSQNPVFEVSANEVSLAWSEDFDSMTLGGDIVIKGGSGSYTFRWYTSDGAELGAESTVTVNGTGVYFLDITDTCDCKITVRFNIAEAGVEDIRAQERLISPNPTGGIIRFEGIDAVQLTAIDMAGRLAALVEKDGSVFHEADLSHLPGGLYIVALTDLNGKVIASKIIKN